MKLLSLKIDNPGGNPISINGPQGLPTGGLGEVTIIVSTLLGFLLLFAVIFTLLVLIYGGWQWMTSSGDKQKIANARQRLTYALVGIVATFAAFLILTLLGTFFGVNLLNLPKT